jgi:hypothetical protein
MQGFQHTVCRNSKAAVLLLLLLQCSCSCAECNGGSCESPANVTRGCLKQTPSAAEQLYPVQLTVQSSARSAKQQAAAVGGAPALGGSKGVSRRHLQQSVQQSPANRLARLEEWAQSTTWVQTYANGSCFPSGRVHQAANITGGPDHCCCRAALVVKLVYAVCGELSCAALGRACCLGSCPDLTASPFSAVHKSHMFSATCPAAATLSKHYCWA